MPMANFSDHLWGIGSGLRWPPTCPVLVYTPAWAPSLECGQDYKCGEKVTPQIGFHRSAKGRLTLLMMLSYITASFSWRDVLLASKKKTTLRWRGTLGMEQGLSFLDLETHPDRQPANWECLCLSAPQGTLFLTTRNKTLIDNWWTWRRSQASDQIKAQPTPGFPPDETLSRELS